MTRFYPVYARRSDGVAEVASKGKRGERNEPTAEQLDQKPDKNGVSDYYREVPADEPKHLDWRRKLGGMLAREMDRGDKGARGLNETSFMLVAFPENYRLYEHVKKTERDGQLEVKSKTHAAGGNDRQDAYLYGHPVGRRKRYRSPAEFFPHLLWLCTDESGDPDNCSCKLCQPEDLDGPTNSTKSKAMERVVPPPLLQSDLKPAPQPQPPALAPTPTPMSHAYPSTMGSISTASSQYLPPQPPSQYLPPQPLQTSPSEQRPGPQFYDFTTEPDGPTSNR